MFAGLRWILTLKCRPFSRLASDELDRRLSAAERAAMTGHWLACRSCRRFRRQVSLLDRMARQAEPIASDAQAQAIERIRRRLREEIQTDT